MPLSLRWKVAALITLACCAITAAVGLLVHRTTLSLTMSRGEERALYEVELVVTQYRANAPPDERSPYTDWIMPVDRLPAPLREKLAVESPATWYFDENPEALAMWAARSVGKGLVAVAPMDMTASMSAWRALDRAMVKAALTALAVVLPASLLLAEPAYRRLRRVAATARTIADGDLDARVDPGRGARDEITDISAAVNSMAASLHHRLRAEQRFTADVAHDLRTPLMGLVTAAELLDDGEAADLVRDRARVLRTLVEDLLEVSRLDAGAEVAERVPVPLAELARQSAARVGVAAGVRASGDPVAETDPRRLDRILANLLLNAHRHGAPPVEITVGDRVIEVRDRGPGFSPDLLAGGPERFRTGSAERGHGHGLGLTIALGQAGVIGADLTLSNAPDGGAVATLRLP
ncbi:two-component sensor histidine kinase [Spongiactinospora rosea]|uniref:histidine kinase n=1 Tax=Spongiactinospora rosea TaxID=2248750 RepID=A0A366LU10_9ACTN|nr:HAMP domain-containing sensor histidine kinase [Spongiactinospora rosea]RBQ17023.1 two-component sensor histidine kinase [Spongiactinospora rosea]